MRKQALLTGCSLLLLWVRMPRADHAFVGMSHIPGGTFSMGMIEHGAEPNEGPVRLVTLRGFFLDRTEVTVDAYRACVTKGACPEPLQHSPDCTYGRRDGKLPMNCVSFDEADRFCLSVGKRLPTEAEWERAARGDGVLPWPWGDAHPDCDHAVSKIGRHSADGCSMEGPLPVGGRSEGAGPYGTLDLAGNVEEWVSDFYDDRYDPTAVHEPQGPMVGVAHVLRGGSWLSPYADLRVSARSWAAAEERGPAVGFRCARGE